ncbi:PolC-type DNA polymerase III [Ferrovibrio sp.]|jgi:DNA polymerase-3 subunit epsilon|uniref:3'-5' exonuclease n=1 Tax=Ferrovibrio sp. TaxID=1917215 RepID=UPI0035B15646
MRRRLISGMQRLLGAVRSAPVAARFTLPADEPLSTLPALLFDTETTGLNVRRDRLVSLGGLPCRGVELQDMPPLDFLVHPGIKIPPASTAIHGISDAMVATAPSLPLIWSSLQLAWQGRVMIGHNIAYDLALLRHEAERHRLPFHPPAAALDLGLLYAGLKPRVSSITLEHIATEFGIGVNGRHTALGDAEACLGIWARMLPALTRIGVATLGGAQALMQRQRDILHGQGNAGWAIELLLPHGHAHATRSPHG